MTASDGVTVTVRGVAPKVEITNVEFTAIGSKVQRSKRREVVKEATNLAY